MLWILLQAMWGQGVAARQDTTDNTARDTYIRDALDNFKAVHIVIPLLPKAPSNWLYTIPHLFWCPTQNPFSPVPGTEKEFDPQHQLNLFILGFLSQVYYMFVLVLGLADRKGPKIC